MPALIAIFQQLKSKLGDLLEGHVPTLEDKLRIALEMGVSEQYLDDLLVASALN